MWLWMWAVLLFALKSTNKTAKKEEKRNERREGMVAKCRGDILTPLVIIITWFKQTYDFGVKR